MRRHGFLAFVALVFAALAVASCTAGGGSGPSQLLGTWTFVGDDSTISVQSAGFQPLAGSSIRIADGPTGPELDIGCLCHVPLKLAGDQGSSSGDDGDRTCEIVVLNSDVRIASQSWTLTLDPGPVMRVHATGTAFVEQQQFLSVTFSIDGHLAPRADLVPHCAGDKKTAVGVFPYLNSGSCVVGTGMEAVEIYMDNQDLGCNGYTNGSGQTFWVDPEAVKPPDPCGPPNNFNLNLAFCRVDGDLFQPFAEDARGGAPYAVLQLGSVCPAGSVAISKHISNETSHNANSIRGINYAPNQSISSALGTFTELHFCLFEPSAAAVGVQAEFPDLGMPYAIFHDFDSFQPPWVMEKSWFLTEDAFSGNHDAYDPAVGGPTDDLERIVEDYRRSASDGQHIGTWFDAARVR